MSFRPLGARYNGTTWSVKFSLDNVESDATYKLRMAIASATNSDLEVTLMDLFINPSATYVEFI